MRDRSNSQGLLPCHREYVGIGERVGPAEIFQKLSGLLLGRALSSKNSRNLGNGNLQFQFPLLQDFGIDLSGDQVITLDLNVDVSYTGFVGEGKKLRTDKRIEA